MGSGKRSTEQVRRGRSVGCLASFMTGHRQPGSSENKSGNVSQKQVLSSDSRVEDPVGKGVRECVSVPSNPD